MNEEPISAPPKTVNGVTFRCYRSGTQSYVWRSDDGRCAAWSPVYRDSHRASVDGKMIGKKFRSLENAMKAAAQAALTSGEQR